jgi:hypothetical protein
MGSKHCYTPRASALTNPRPALPGDCRALPRLPLQVSESLMRQCRKAAGPARAGDQTVAATVADPLRFSPRARRGFAPAPSSVAAAATASGNSLLLLLLLPPPPLERWRIWRWRQQSAIVGWRRPAVNRRPQTLSGRPSTVIVASNCRRDSL